MVDVVAALPAQAAALAGDSVGAAVAIAARVGGPVGEALAAAARSSFVDALGVAAVVAAGVTFATAVFVARTMPSTTVVEEAAAAGALATAPGAGR